ncbi:MAG: hypothetical protein KJZ86_05970 [Caldilineaceae bacterium]|nr:hypothetical protein [Caldilineaceae bacterium]HRJ41803.1 hypothetical protein [Caldilineaceae bacterium]
MKALRGDGVGKELLAELAPWLVAAALVDWLLLRTVSRTAIFMPKTPLLAELFLWLGRAGQLAANAATLLALICLAWIVWREAQQRQGLPLAVVLAGLLATSTLFIVVPPGRWLVVVQLLLIATLFLLLFRLGQRQNRGAGWVFLPGGGALLLAGLHQAMPGLAGSLFQWGEALVVVSPLAFWWVYGRSASRWVQIGAILPGLIFGAVYLASPSMTATIVVWSTGLTLYLPWWVYALGLWAAGVVLWQTLAAQANGAGRMVGYGLLLLAAGGYAPQLSVHQFLGVIALYLLVAVSSPGFALPVRENSVSQTATFHAPPSRVSPPV